MSPADRIAELRRAYADELADLAKITHEPLKRAFAAVPREAFLGPGPWKLFSPGLQQSLTPDDDPAHVYRNVLVNLDAAKNLNNGEPRFWAVLFELVKPKAGERAIHVGAGTGYYSAILAEMVGPAGQVTAIEYEPDLAERARASLAAWPSVEVLAGDGMALAEGPADVIVASCGIDQVPLGWVRLLKDGGRLLVPLTVTMPDWSGGGWGASLLITRHGERFGATLEGGVGIYHCKEGRSFAAEVRLKAALQTLRQTGAPIASLRLDDAPDETCWLAGDGWWLSTAAA